MPPTAKNAHRSLFCQKPVAVNAQADVVWAEIEAAIASLTTIKFEYAAAAATSSNGGERPSFSRDALGIVLERRQFYIPTFKIYGMEALLDLMCLRCGGSQRRWC